jgi:hypothetical protein
VVVDRAFLVEMEPRDTLVVVIQDPSVFLAKDGQKESRIVADFRTIPSGKIIAAEFIISNHFDSDGKVVPTTNTYSVESKVR